MGNTYIEPTTKEKLLEYGETMIHLKRLTICFVLASTMFALCVMTGDIHPQIVGTIVGLIFLWGGMGFGFAFILYMTAILTRRELK